MPTARSALHFQRLVDTPGTGNISPLTAEIRVRFTGKHYASRRAGTLVVIAEAALGGGRPDAAVLDGVAEVAAELAGP